MILSVSDKVGWTSLMWSARFGKLVIVKILFDNRGAKIDAQNNVSLLCPSISATTTTTAISTAFLMCSSYHYLIHSSITVCMYYHAFSKCVLSANVVVSRSLSLSHTVCLSLIHR